MKKVLLLSLFCFASSLSFVSCSSDSDGDGTGSQMKYYIVDSKNAANPEYDYKMRYNLLNGKRYSEKMTESESGVSETIQTHFYTNGLLTSQGTMYTSGNYFYDDQQNLIASDHYSDVEEGATFRRFIAISPNESYSEFMTAAHDNPAAEISRRIILKFDANNNVIEAGYDANLDGVIDIANHFSYDSNDNMIQAQSPDETFNYSYSQVINNYSVIEENTYGKKELRLIQAYVYATIGYAPAMIHSRYLSQENFESAQYDLMPNGFFKRETRAFNSNGGSTVKTTFYFE